MMDLRDQIQNTLGDGFRVERELGGGGMSRVFVAVEQTLDRRIVVKVLPPEMVARVSSERFRREIRLAASLQHPHIVPLLSAGESEGLPYYTMPFVKGESLRERLLKGELSIKDALHVLHDVASALAYAHSEGIVHRDIKPENIILSGGVAVVTDFGVSKAVNVATNADTSPTGLTSLGIALGTPAYMSPEQASADARVDHRADIYSFGCVAYEMLTGASPFAGRPLQQMLAAQVMEVPDSVAKRRPNVPPALATLVARCLEKRAGDRPQSAEDLLAALDAISTPSGGTEPTSARIPAVRRPRRVAYAVAGAGVLLLAGGMLWWRLSAFTPLQVGATIAPIAISPALETQPAISPDGKLVAYSASTADGFKIFVRQVDGDRPTLVGGDLHDGDQLYPQWSPDGARVLFAALRGVYVVHALGGTPKLLFEVNRGDEASFGAVGGIATTPSWSPDGRRIAYADATGIWIRAVAGGEPKLVFGRHLVYDPVWSPDGERLVFVDGRAPTFANVSTTTVWVISQSGGDRTRVSDSVHVNTSPTWAPDGKSLLFVSNRGGAFDVYQQALRGNAPSGDPVRLTTNLGAYHISISANAARMAYDVVRGRDNVWTVNAGTNGVIQLSEARPVTTDNQRVEAMSVSHDGHWLTYDSNRDGNSQIYKVNLDGGQPIRLTNTPTNEFRPTWSPDDREIAFYSNRTGSRHLYVMNADGNAEQQVTTGPREDYLGGWAPDGRQIVFTADSAGKSSLDVVARNSAGRWTTPRRLEPRALVLSSNWSPDGQWVAYTRPDNAMALVSPDGKRRRVVADSSTMHGVAGVARWGRDPHVVYVSSWSGNGYFIWRIPLSGGPATQLVREDANHRVARPEFAMNGNRFFFTLAQDESDVYVVDLKRR
jgi:Tol biopolymer transport system component